MRCDITRCTGISCDKRKECRRFTDETEGDTYFLNPPLSIATQECEMFWDCNTEHMKVNKRYNTKQG